MSVLFSFQNQHHLRPGWLNSQEFTTAIRDALGPNGMRRLPHDFRERLETRLESLAERKGLVHHEAEETQHVRPVLPTTIARAERRQRRRSAATLETTTRAASSQTSQGPVGLTREAEARARSLAAMVGADPDFLIQELRTTRVDVHRGSDGTVSVVTRPQSAIPIPRDERGEIILNDPVTRARSLSRYLAHNILSEAYGVGERWEERPMRGGRSTADFSEANMNDGALAFIQLHPNVIDGNVELRRGHGYGAMRALLTQEANRLGTDRYELQTTLLRYKALQDTNPTLAEEYLRRSGASSDMARSVRTLSTWLSSQTVGEGPTAYYIVPSDMNRARRALRESRASA